MAAGIGIVCMAAVSEMAHEKVTGKKGRDWSSSYFNARGNGHREGREEEQGGRMGGKKRGRGMRKDEG